ncbi:MAG: STAS domain-containing protein [Pseudomonadales bacterium]|nr:STAS domain-containing protein [Pseudomonadales bacterium]
MSIQSIIDGRVQVVDGCLLLTLPGGLETRSLDEFRDEVLAVIHARGLKVLVGNMSEIDVIDAMLITFIEDLVNTLRILGCAAVVAGITPQCAAAMTRMGLDFGEDVRTVLSVDDAIRLLRDGPVDDAAR